MNINDYELNKTIENEINTICNKKNNNIIDTLVLAGGGVKGFVLIGAIKYLEEHNIMSNIKTFIGTSVGGYLSLLYIIGYTSDDLSKFGKLIDMSKTTTINIQNLFDNYSFSDYKNFDIILKKLFNNKKINENITLIELFKLTKKKFVVTTTCINDKNIEYISYDNHPDMPVITAIKMTTCVPLLFPYIKYNNKIYIDGGIVENFPINYIFKEGININKVIGLNIKTEISSNINNILDYILCIFNIFIHTNDNNKINLYKKYPNNIFNILMSNKNPLNFNLSNDEKKEMLKIGYEFMKSNYHKLSDLSYS